MGLIVWNICSEKNSVIHTLFSVNISWYSAGDKFNDYMVTNAIVSSNGGVLWMFPALIKTYCTLNVKYFPFDEQNCELVFISWTHSGYELDVNHNSNFSNVVYYKSENQAWLNSSNNTHTMRQHTQYYLLKTSSFNERGRQTNEHRTDGFGVAFWTPNGKAI